MRNYIPEEKVSEIKNAADIVDVISEAVALKKTGKNYLGLCPFHSEKTPSFSVSPEKQIFYCFGCGEGGNIFSFIMKREGLTFPEAARILSRRYGIEIPAQKMSPEQKQRMGEREGLLKINSQAMEFFHWNLLETPAGKKALSYLSKRGTPKEIIHRFKLGFAPERWDGLTNYFLKKRIPTGILEKSGLIIRRKTNNGFYDRFRGRIVFPIFDVSAQVIGFGGRVMDDSLPKYLNSPETPIYNKRRSLYGVHQAKNRCREKESVYIVEGYFDLLALHQHGMENSVATLGTALTKEHVRVLKGLVGTDGKVALVFDSDEAGIKAAQRCIETFDKEYVNAQIIVLPSGHDPDSYLLEFGAESFENVASTNRSGILSFLIDTAVKKHGLSIEGKINIISDLGKPLASIDDTVDRSLFIKELAERINLNEKSVLDKVRELSGDKEGPQREEKIDLASKISGQTIHNKLERRIIAMMLQFSPILAEIETRNILNRFDDDMLKSIGHTILDAGADLKKQPADIITLIDDRKGARAIAAQLAIGEDVWDYEGCLRLIKQFENSRTRRQHTLLEKIRAAEKQQNYELLTRLLKEKQPQAKINKDE